MTSFLLLLAIAPAQLPAPAVDPKQLAAWVADLSDKDYKKQQAARDALVKVGPRAKPVLPDLIKLLGRPGEKATWGRINAVDVLAAIGPEAKDAVPALMTLVKPESYSVNVDRIAIAVAKIDGPKPEVTSALLQSTAKGSPIVLASSTYLQMHPAEAAGHLVDLCKDPTPEVRRRAVIVLAGLPVGYYASSAPPLAAQVKIVDKAAPLFETMLADTDPAVRMTAAHGLSHMTPDRTAKAIPAVVATMTDAKLKDQVGGFRAADILRPAAGEAAQALVPLFDGADHGRAWAIDTLAHLAALPAKDTLEAELKSGKTPRSRQGAAMCLGARRPGGATSAPALKDALADRDFIVRFAAAVALVQVGGPKTETAAAGVPILIEGLGHSEDATRRAAAENLRTVGEPARSAVPALKRTLADRNPEVALGAALALVEIALPESADAVPVLTAGVGGTDEKAAARAAKALATLGPMAKTAIPELVKRFDAKTPELRLAAAEAAARIDPAQGDKAAAVLTALFHQFNYGQVRNEVVFALTRIGPPAKAALPALLDVFRNAQKGASYFRVEIALAVLAIDPETAKPVVAWIRELVTKDGDEDGYELAGQIRRLGAGAKPLMAELIAMLGVKEPFVRECAAVALGAIGPDAKDALPKLKALAAADGQERVRKLAADAVKRVEAK